MKSKSLKKHLSLVVDMGLMMEFININSHWHHMAYIISILVGKSLIKNHTMN